MSWRARAPAAQRRVRTAAHLPPGKGVLLQHFVNTWSTNSVTRAQHGPHIVNTFGRTHDQQSVETFSHARSPWSTHRSTHSGTHGQHIGQHVDGAANPPHQQ
eukprot:1711180-Pyramimonas_sp.AAC.1